MVLSSLIALIFSAFRIDSGTLRIMIALLLSIFPFLNLVKFGLVGVRRFRAPHKIIVLVTATISGMTAVQLCVIAGFVIVQQHRVGKIKIDVALQFRDCILFFHLPILLCFVFLIADYIITIKMSRIILKNDYELNH